MTVLYIADFFKDQVQGGAEISDNVVIEYLSQRIGVHKIQSHNFQEFLNIEAAIKGRIKTVIVSNFANMSEDFKQKLQTDWKSKYIVIERDNKFIKNRNLALYKNYEAPLEDVANRDFYQNAKKVFGLTTKHVQYMKRYLDPANIESLGCTHFDKQSIEYLRDLINTSVSTEDTNMYAIMRGKRQDLAEHYCKVHNLSYTVLPKLGHKEFLYELSKYQGLVFFSHAVEAFCRVILEARILGLEIITDDKNGVAYEKWFQENKGQDLLSELEIKTTKSLEIILKAVL